MKRVYGANNGKWEHDRSLLPANAPGALGYRQFLRANAAQFGITPESVDSMAKPVLVRVRITSVNRAEFARQANASTVAQMSPAEQARSDAKRIDSMDDLNPTEDGDFATSRDFIKRFVGRLPKTEQWGMNDASGALSSSGYARVRNAVLAKAYGDSPVLTRMVESMDDNLRNVSKALMIAAPQVAQARQAIGDGRRFDADITPHLVSAVEELGRLRDAGTSVDDALAQAGLMGETYTPETRDVLRFLADNTRRPRKMAEFIGAYFDALDAAGDPAQGSLLGDVQAPTTTDLMASARRATQGETNAAVATNPERAVDREAAPDRAGPGRQPGDAPGNRGGDQGDGVARAAEDRFPRVATIHGLSNGPGGHIKPHPIAAGQKLYRETNLSGLDDLLRLDGQADLGSIYVTDQRDLALGQGTNRGVLVTFRPDSLSGREHRKPGTGDLTGREYRTDIVAPRAVQTIEMVAADVPQLRGLTRRALKDFVREPLDGGRLRLHRRGLPGTPAESLEARHAHAVERAKDALSDVASILSKHTRAAMLPESTPGLMPALVKLFDAAIDIVGTDLKAATKWVREQLRAEPRTKALWNRVAPETYRKAAVQALERRDGRGDASGLFGADELPLLSTYSDADLKEKTEREDAAAKADVQEQRDQTVKASADAQRSEFTLTGSNRTADVAAAAGQRGIFDQAPPSAAPALAEKAPVATKIDDVGEKVGGARKDMAISGATVSKRATEDDRPSWARRFSVSQIVRASGQINAWRDEGRWVIYDTRSTDWTGQPRQVGRDTFATKEDADVAVPLAAVSLKHRPVPTRDGKYEIWRDVTDRKRVKVVERAFDTREDALAYMMANAVAIVETNTTFGEADLPLPPDRARDGPQRRTGNVNGGDFKDAFGLRGVEFGNWNNQDERQALMNDAWDGLMDLADVLGVPAKALGLNGDLALAFGARGHGLNSARAHYELERAVINLTKERGAGSLAHEWFHALDHYFGRQDGKASATWQVQPDGTRTLKTAGADVDMASAGFRGERSGVRPELRTAYERLLTTMTKKAEVYVEDTAKVDQFTGRAKEELAGALDKLRAELSAQKDPAYYKRNNKPASAELLAEFDTIAKAMVGGELLTTDWRTFAAGTEKRPALAARWTNESLERLSAIYKEVRGRSGFDSTSRDGVMDRMRGYMGPYSQRLKMLADAQQGSEKTRMVPTEFAMNAKELDQGRGGDYWTTPHEMAARAFQGYVEDTIAERGGVSRFLNYAPENAAILTPWGAKRPYPAGAERKAINVALDAFVKELKTRTDDDGNVALLSRGSGGGIAYKDLLTVASVISEKLPGLPKVNVLSSPATAPKSLQDAIRARNAMSDAEGALHQGEIYLFASGIRDAERAEHMLAEHEAAHAGLRGILGNALPQQMQAIFNLNASVRRQVAAMLESEPGLSLAEAVEEVLVDMPSASLAKLKGWRALVGKAVQWMAAHGFEITATKLSRWLKGTLSQQDQADLFVANLVRDARAFVRSASATSVDGTRLSRNTRGGDTVDGKSVPEPDPPQQSPWTKAKAKVKQLTDPKVIDRLIYETQDKLIDLKRLREHIKAIGGTITDLNDAYLGEELYHKRLAKRTEDFLKEELQPLLADMRARGVGTDEFERYLHARHAPEANKALAERNPNQATLDDLRDTARREAQTLDAKLVHARRNGSATKAIEEALALARAESSRLSMAQAYRGAEAERKSLSGMSDADAQELIGALTADQKSHLDALAARVDVINAQTLELLERYGLMSQASIDAWRRAYQFYVPLHRDEAHVDSRSHPIGSGFSVKGDAARQRVGSNEKVTHILGHIAMQRETALTRGEKNNVVKQLYLMAAQNPDREFWSLDKLPTTKTVDPATGYVRTGVDPAFKTRPNVVMVRVAGRDVAITFNEHNPQALRLAEAMKNLDVGDLHVVLGLAAKGTRWFAAVNTQYNPIFGLINFARDFQEGMLNLSTTPIAGKQRDVASNVFKAMRAIYRTERGKSAADAEWTRLWKEMQDVGGTTGYRDLFADAGERVKALQKELTALDRGQVSKAAHALVDWLSDYNETMENAVRLSAYKAALDNGLTRVRAASVAKNLTVNFNRKGRQTREIGALYAFFNASMQGTARMFETLRGPMGKRIMYGGVALGAINTLLGMAAMGGGGDDDRDDAWERIPEFIKERNLIIPVSGEDYVAIPMPLGFKVFPNIGRLAVEFAFGGPEKSATRQLGKLLMTFADAFNPLGGAQNIGQMAAPTVIDPIAALMTNKDWNGRPIYRENVNGLDPQPGHAMAKDSSSTPARGLARAINAITGGTEYRPGAWSPTPDQIDYVVGQLTGGLGRELLKANQTVASTFTGDELPPYKIPLVGRLYGNTRGSAGHSGAFYENVKTLNELENELKGRQRNDQDVDALFRQEPLMGLISLGNNAENVVRRLRGERRQIVERRDPDSKDRIREVDAEITETMSDLNREVSRARREPAPAN